MRREIGLVDHQQIGFRQPRPALARDVLPGGGVDHVDRQIRQFRAEGGGKVVAPRFDQHQIEIRKRGVEIRHGGEVDRGILADRGMRAAPRLDPADAVAGQHLRAHQVLGILARVDVVGDHRHRTARGQRPRQPFGQRGLARAHRAADAHPQRAVHALRAHVRNILTSWVSCCSAARSPASAQVPIVERGAVARACARSWISGVRRASTACPSVWPAARGGWRRSRGCRQSLAGRARSRPLSAGRAARRPRPPRPAASGAAARAR